MGTVQLYLILAALVSLHAAVCQAALQGLYCVNDFINNVTCTWDSSSADPGPDCRITGHKKTRFKENGVRRTGVISQSCRVTERANSPPGCSLVFESNKFTPFEVMPNISLTCDRLVVLILKDYPITSHIQMHPPGLPNVSRTDNDTVIWWGPSSPLSEFLNEFDYQVRVQQSGPNSKEANTWPTSEAHVRIPAWQPKGEYRVRVRVKPANREGSQWSEWSPTTSWATGSENHGWGLDPTFLILAVFIVSAVLVVATLAVYKSIVSQRLLKAQPVPNPSKYFQTLHSVHRGNLKKWLNPHYAAETLDTTQPLDHISPVEVCEGWDARPSTSSSVCVPPPPLDSSSASSCFSNLDYFVSGSSGSSLLTNPNPAYFTDKDDAHALSLRLCPDLTDESPSCESFKRGAQSPDSGFCIGKEDADVKGQRRDAIGLEDHLSSSHLSLPLSPSSPPSLSSDSAPMQPPVLAAYVGTADWAAASAMCRSSSMPVESSKAGYFILQEIQTTFSNASI